MPTPDSAGRPQAELIREFVEQRTWAIVGASNDHQKFGNRIYRNLRAAGYTVFAVNLHESEVEGDRAYPTLADLPRRPDVVDLVVPPAAGVSIVRQCADLGLRRVWFQPGAESDAALERCRELGIEAVHHACAMVHRRIWPAAERS